ncbi:MULTISPECIES: class I SAM-dependent methyltransferase [Paenibacillus]|uniref:Methyltransferase n=1 Tax=Paenibacillus albilobatus TaxID=2716884 RepID=A0A919XBY0_9BACL|nr:MULTISPECIES: class I SAM-dependent methyltransferase [Paenibacillus]GIO29659.1 methyltransferase [Paenibacillus albilobatus]
MPMDFHDPRNQTSYTTRVADASWLELISKQVELKGKRAADIGCGGGIYTKALLALGAEHVIGVDFSAEMLRGAKQNVGETHEVEWIQGTATESTLPSEHVDVVLERALIHHLNDLPACFREARRMLKTGGTLIVQDRTPEDSVLPGSDTHIRGYIFEKFPRLMETEMSRRHDSAKVTEALRESGFRDIRELKWWEPRAVHPDPEALFEDLRRRTGRSILHELSDAELEELITYIDGKIKGSGPIVEKDPWTLWFAKV